MKKSPYTWSVTTMASNAHAQKMYPWPTSRDSVDKAVSTENLRAVAYATTDSQVLLGLAFLAQAGNPVRQELSEMALKAKPEYAPVVAVLAIAMDGGDENSVDELIKRDPDNALGYYLQGDLLYHSGKDKEAFDAFRKAAACSELRLYESITGDALFRALDALNLKGLDRLCAASWAASRRSNFNIFFLQPLNYRLAEMARDASLEAQKEISDLLLVLAGQLFATNFENRTFGERAVESAFRLKAGIAAAENAMNGYAAVVQALMSAHFSWPDITDKKRTPLELARFLPSRVSRAFALADPSQMTATNLSEMNVNLPESHKAAFDRAKENAITAAKALIDVALTDPDGILGAYLKGLPEGKTNAAGPRLYRMSCVEKLMANRPDVFRAAASNEEAMDALYEAGEEDPWSSNMSRMMEVGLGILEYASDHDGRFPDSINVFVEQRKYLKPPLEAKSVLTGQPYVYVAAGEKWPPKSIERERFLLFYDDKVSPDGGYQCILGDGHSERMPVDKVKEHLRTRGK